VLKPEVTLSEISSWEPRHVAAIVPSKLREIPVVTAADIVDVLPGFQLWDSWTVDDPEGKAVCSGGWTLWVIMCAPRAVHPDLRHDTARLRLMQERAGEWRDCGYLLPDELNPGSREWAGSSVFDADNGRLTLFYTVTGRRGEATCSYEQRLFQTDATMTIDNGVVQIGDWSEPLENIVSDGVDYVIVNQHQGRPGFIKGFRDPFHFRDPASGTDYLLFTASYQPSRHSHNGVVGIASSDDGVFANWTLLPPLISADGVNNELERPVLRYVDGQYYVFWSTQRKTFAPGGPAGPNGLYGMVSESLFGPYRPLNGTGLVAPNPEAEPLQTYSWWITSELDVVGFVDLWGLKGQSVDAQPELAVQHFGGVPAPRFRIALDGDRAQIIG
jgi:levansucrase